MIFIYRDAALADSLSMGRTRARERSGKRIAEREEILEDHHRVGKVHPAVIVRVRRMGANLAVLEKIRQDYKRICEV